MSEAQTSVIALATCMVACFATAALVEIAALWCAILWTLALFLRATRLAGWLMAPYLAWVAFAGALRSAIWRLNA